MGACIAGVAAALVCLAALEAPARAAPAPSDPDPQADVGEADAEPPETPAHEPASPHVVDPTDPLALLLELATTGGLVVYSHPTRRGATTVQLLVRRSGVAVSCTY